MGPFGRQSPIANRQSAIPIASRSLPGLPLAPQSESAGLQSRRARVDACGAGRWMVRRLADSFKADPGERNISFPWLPGWPGATGGRRRGSSLAVSGTKRSDIDISACTVATVSGHAEVYGALIQGPEKFKTLGIGVSWVPSKCRVLGYKLEATGNRRSPILGNLSSDRCPLTPSTWHLAPGTSHLAPRTLHLGPHRHTNLTNT